MSFISILENYINKILQKHAKKGVVWMQNQINSKSKTTDFSDDKFYKIQGFPAK